MNIDSPGNCNYNEIPFTFDTPYTFGTADASNPLLSYMNPSYQRTIDNTQKIKGTIAPWASVLEFDPIKNTLNYINYRVSDCAITSYPSSLSGGSATAGLSIGATVECIDGVAYLSNFPDTFYANLSGIYNWGIEVCCTNMSQIELI